MDKAKASLLCARVLGFDEKAIYYKWHQQRESVVKLHDKLLDKLDGVSLEFRDLKKAVRIAGEYLLDYIESEQGVGELNELTLDQYSQLKDALAVLPELIGKEKKKKEEQPLAIIAPEPSNLIPPTPEVEEVLDNGYLPDDEQLQVQEEVEEEEKLSAKDIGKIARHYYRKTKEGEEKITFKVLFDNLPENTYSPEWELSKILDAHGPIKEYIKSLNARGRNTLLKRYPILLKNLKN